MLGFTGILNATTTDLSFRLVSLPLSSSTRDCGGCFGVNLIISIYECHIGMSGEDPGISSYCSFEYSVLPRVIADGYNCVLRVHWTISRRFNSWLSWNMPIIPPSDISAICFMPFRPVLERRQTLW